MGKIGKNNMCIQQKPHKRGQQPKRSGLCCALKLMLKLVRTV